MRWRANALVSVLVTGTACGARTPLSVALDDAGATTTAESCVPPNATKLPSLAPDSQTQHCARGLKPGVCPASNEKDYGQDGNYLLRVPTYSVTADTVVDSITGLTWERAPPGDLVSWEAGTPRCSTLQLAGARDWRIPTRLELVTLLDYGSISTFALPFIYPTYADFWWSSSVHGSFGALGSQVDNFGNAGAQPDTPKGAVRCVRGDAPTPGYVVGGDGATVYDPKTGLEWQRAVADIPPMTWSDALAYCVHLRLVGACDWRLPSVKELLTIVEDTARVPPVDADAFPDAPADDFVTSTPTVSLAGDGDVRVVMFRDHTDGPILYQAGGSVSYVDDDMAKLRVRCVR